VVWYMGCGRSGVGCMEWMWGWWRGGVGVCGRRVCRVCVGWVFGGASVWDGRVAGTV
jgi:hypothetical protein